MKWPRSALASHLTFELWSWGLGVRREAIPIGPNDSNACCASAALKGSKKVLMDGSRGRSDDYTLREWHSINARRPKKPSRSGLDDDDDDDGGVHPVVVTIWRYTSSGLPVHVGDRI